MGRKVHPYGFRVGVTKDWQSKWFSSNNYAQLANEDIVLRKIINRSAREAGIAKVIIDRNANDVVITIRASKPGIVIGRGGQSAEKLREELEIASTKKVKLNIKEIRVPELDAALVAANVAEQLEKRVAFRRAMKQGVQRAIQRGALGCKVKISGRLGGAEMSRSEHEMQGRVPLHTLRANIDYGFAEAHTTYGKIGVKAWIYKGELSHNFIEEDLNLENED
ncbi:MAG: 30S ribosomal protein S3 [Dehalococcoidaceae bacterium]|nr:30S ribosomal protein S3 [Dehalococcoidaceae bacterium]|tara:strand:- start:242 stop:907 length:666 start_codon:yes stop_codon:yes gene_type:complete